MLKKILLGLAAVLVVLLIVISLQPSEFKVSRSTVIQAPAGKIFGYVAVLRDWEKWSPWVKLDPNAKITYEGPASGPGAIMRWEGNSDVGAGSMTLTGGKPPESIDFRLDFLKPMEGTSTANFTFVQEGENTTLTWTMEGHNNFMAKAISLIFNCEKMVGEQFEKGLASLKELAEK